MTATVRSTQAAVTPQLVPQEAIDLSCQRVSLERIKQVVQQNPNCSELHVANCGLTETSLAEIGKLRKLREFDFSGNAVDLFELVDADARNEKSSPIEALMGCRELEVLKLRKILHDEEFSVEHLDVLTNLPRLRELDLSDGTFDFHVSGKFEAFQATLAKMPALRQLIVQNNQQDFTPARLNSLKKVANLTVTI